MRTMVSVWGSGSNVPQLVAQSPWGNIRTILDKATTPSERGWYAAAAVVSRSLADVAARRTW